jgi:hypothetical protein
MKIQGIRSSMISLGAMWRVIWGSILLENEKPSQGLPV